MNFNERKEDNEMLDYKVKIGLVAMRRNTTDRPRGTFLTWYSAEQRGKRFVDYIEKNFVGLPTLWPIEEENFILFGSLKLNFWIYVNFFFLSSPQHLT